MGNQQHKPRFAFTDVERRTLFVLGLLLVIGLVGKQVLRYSEPEQGVMIQGNPEVVAEADASCESKTPDSNEGSGSLAPSVSESVPSALHVSSSDSETIVIEQPDPQEFGDKKWDDVTSRLQPEQVQVRASESDGSEEHRIPDASGSAGNRFDLNKATAEQLESIPGVGPVIAGRITDWRAEHGSFQRLEDLLLIEGIGEKRLATITQYAYVQPRNNLESKGKHDGGNEAL